MITNDGYRIIMLQSPGYARNVSLSRLWDHYRLAQRFKQRCTEEPRPDIIICSAPIIEFCQAAVEYGRQNNVPVVIDIRDLWPDIFIEVLPRPLRWIAWGLLAHYDRILRAALRDATAITGHTTEFVNWGLRKAGRGVGSLDRDFPMGYLEEVPNPESLARANRVWDEHGISNSEFVVCFFGTIGRQFDLKTVIDAARILQQLDLPIRFILCGDGEKRGHYQQLAGGQPHVVFPGWIGRADIYALMRRSAAGLAPYVNNPNFRMNLPNKIIEYLSAGLPIVSSVKGVLGQLITANDCGATYGNAQELAEVLRRLYLQRHELERISHNAANLYAERFRAEKVYGQMAHHIERIARDFQR